jgi:hypothetical protein
MGKSREIHSGKFAVLLYLRTAVLPCAMALKRSERQESAVNLNSEPAVPDGARDVCFWHKVQPCPTIAVRESNSRKSNIHKSFQVIRENELIAIHSHEIPHKSSRDNREFASTVQVV